MRLRGQLIPQLARLGACSLLAAVCLASCNKAAAPDLATDSGSDTPPPALSASTAASAAALEAPQPAATPRTPMQLLDFAFTSAVKNKNPVDKLESASPGSRVYAHAVMRNRSGEQRRLTFEFKVNEEPRTQIDLDVDESWSYRTWAFNTIRSTDKGVLFLRITDDTGVIHVERSLPIRK